ncbi:hypothetical protein [Shewanella sp. Koi 1]
MRRGLLTPKYTISWRSVVCIKS